MGLIEFFRRRKETLAPDEFGEDPSYWLVLERQAKMLGRRTLWAIYIFSFGTVITGFLDVLLVTAISEHLGWIFVPGLLMFGYAMLQTGAQIRMLRRVERDLK